MVRLYLKCPEEGCGKTKIRSHSALCLHLMNEHEKPWGELKESFGALAIAEHAEERIAVMSDLEFRTTKPSKSEGTVICNRCGQDVLCRNVLSHFTGARSKCGEGLTKELVADWWAVKDAHPLKGDRFYHCLHAHLHKLLSAEEEWFPENAGSDDALGAENNPADVEELPVEPPAASDAVSSDVRPMQITLDLVDADLDLWADQRGTVYRLIPAPNLSSTNRAGNMVGVMRATSKAKCAPARPPALDANEERPDEFPDFPAHLGRGPFNPSVAATEMARAGVGLPEAPSSQQWIASQFDELKSLLPPPMSVKQEELQVKAIVFSYEKPDDSVKRKDFPWKADLIDWEPLRKYLVRKFDDQTADIYMRAVSRFVSMVETLDLGVPTLDGVLINSYRSGVFDELEDTELMAFERSWSRNIIYGLDHLANVQRVEVGKIRDQRTKDFLAQIQEEVFKPWEERCCQHARMRTIHKKIEDNDVIDQEAPKDIVKAAVKQCMIDVHTIVKHLLKLGYSPMRAKQVLNRKVVGVLFYNQLGHRSQEWQELLEKDYLDSMQAHPSYIDMTKYKTSATYGVLGKRIFDGTRTMIEWYFQAPERKHIMFLEPSLDKTKKVSVHKALLSFHENELAEWSALTVNQLRKKVATEWDKTPEGEVKAGKEDVTSTLRHGKGCHKGNYIVSNPKKDAERGERVFRTLMGDPVEWPTPAELKEGARSRPYETLMSRRSLKGASSDCVADGDGDDENELPADQIEEEATENEDEEEEARAGAWPSAVVAETDNPKRKRSGDSEGEEEEDKKDKKGKKIHESRDCQFGEEQEEAVGGKPGAGEELTEEDMLAISTHCMQQRKVVFSDSEKVFIVRELRKAQRKQQAPNLPVDNRTLKAVISEGQLLQELLNCEMEDELVYLEKVRHFAHQFTKVAHNLKL